MILKPVRKIYEAGEGGECPWYHICIATYLERSYHYSWKLLWPAFETNDTQVHDMIFLKYVKSNSGKQT